MREEEEEEEEEEAEQWRQGRRGRERDIVVVGVGVKALLKVGWRW